MPTNSLLYYRHSMRFSASAIPIVLLAGALAALAGGFVYGVVVKYIPFIYLNFLLTLGLGFGLGWLVFGLCKWTAIRNPVLAAVLGLVCGLVAEYANFVGWVSALADWTDLIYLPGDLSEALDWIITNGVWSIGKNSKTPVTGLVLELVWLVEAGVIVGCATVLPYRSIRNLAYCEGCGRWAEETKSFGPFSAITDPKTMRVNLEAGGFSALDQLKRVDIPGSRFSEIVLTRCPQCDQLHLLTIHDVRTSIDKNGEVKKKINPVVSQMIIDAESAAMIEVLAKTPEKPPVEAITLPEPGQDPTGAAGNTES